MIIEHVEIRNFRSLLKVDLDFDELTAILGRNGGGKSSILKALDVFYNVSYLASPFDYFGKDTNQEIKISVTYSDLHADELQEFVAYLSNGKLSVSKIINAGGAKYYGASRQIPAFYEARKLGAVDKRNRLNELVKSATFAGFDQKVSSNEQAEQAMSIYESAHQELTQPFEKEQQFFGPRNVGGGKLDKFTKFVLIPAVRDAASETDKKGTIHQLIDVLVARNVNSRPDVLQLNAEFEQRVKDVYNHNNLTELSELAVAVTKLLSQYAPGAGLDLDFEEVIPPKISLPAALASLVEDNFKSPISYSGHGVQRALVLALLQQLSITDMTPPTPTQESKTEDAAAPADPKGNLRLPDLILAIEEPELYLHPSRSRYLSSVLKRLSQKPTDSIEPRTQVIYATHSPYFIDLDQFDRIRIARKTPVQDISTLQCTVTSYSKGKAAERLAKISGRNPDEFSAASFIAHTVPVMSTIVNEGFFADVAVVVEGLSDVGALWALQEIKDMAWDAEGITVVPANGKNNIDRPVVVFEGFAIPTYFIFDGDADNEGKKDHKNTAEKNRAYLVLAGEQPEDFPKTQVRENFAVFHLCLEKELELAVGTDKFQTIRQEVATVLGYQEASKALKNLEGTAMFIKLAYEGGFTIPVLEDIVNRVSLLKANNKSKVL
jgi:putative ATP-dependent endonuclease of OLD family